MNAPLEASNLNNPCPKLRQSIGFYSPGSDLEVTWTNNTTHPDIKLLQLLASQCAVASRKALTESNDFLSSDYTGPRTATLSVSTLNLLKEREVLQSPRLQLHLPNHSGHGVHSLH